MKADRARFVVVVVFLTSLTVQLGLISFTYLKGAIYADEVLAAILRLMSVYAVHLSVILGVFFGQGRKNYRVKAEIFALAIVLTILWNLLLVWRTVAYARVAFGFNDSVDLLTKYIVDVGQASSFLVVGVLAYLFTNQHSNPRRET